MREIYNQARRIVDKANLIKWELSGFNPGTDREPIPISDIKNKSIALQESVADLINMLDRRIKDGD
ncbi:hypothetical protein J7M07_01730 [bacterium]|nr:hypothetical protein [bacterium]